MKKINRVTFEQLGDVIDIVGSGVLKEGPLEEVTFELIPKR